MKKLSVLALVLISNAAFAHEDFAKIKNVEPQYATIARPIEVCREEIVQDTVYPQVQNEKNYAGVIIGGIAGGILGNQVGKGNGNKVATAAGAVAGALIGDSMANSSANNHQGNAQPQIISRKVRNCRMEETTEQEITGYLVEYTYHGQQLSYIAKEKPVGSKIRVHVHVTPVENQF